MIHEVRANQPIIPAQAADIKQKNQPAEQAAQSVKKDTVEISKAGAASANAAPEAAKNNKADAATIAKLRAEADQATHNLRTLVQRLLAQQGMKSDIAVNGNAKLLDAEAIAQAQDAISEKGEFGVEAVSERLFKAAVAMSGGDTTKLEEMKAAIQKGFKQAEKAFGGGLPEICHKTLDATMTKLDNWAKGEAQA